MFSPLDVVLLLLLLLLPPRNDIPATMVFLPGRVSILIWF
jgi:hypothetical protein